MDIFDDYELHEFWWTVMQHSSGRKTRCKLVEWRGSTKALRKQLKKRLEGTEWTLSYVKYWGAIELGSEW